MLAMSILNWYMTMLGSFKEKSMENLSKSRRGEMNVMDASGHKQLTWHLDDKGEIVRAKDAFDHLIGHGYSAFGPQKNEAKHLIRHFDPTAEEIIMVPRIVGG